jgi:chemotaxis protein methyltransferase CheR
MVDCRKLNLAAPWPAFPKFDVVFIRNVLIYFDKSAKESILTRVARTMAADGKLFLGGGETLINLDVPLIREVAGPTICFAPILPA